jgi:hypothetical protein
MKNTENIIRDFFHLFIGFTVLYIIGSYTDFDTYTLEGKIIGCTSVSFTLGGILGFGWENGGVDSIVYYLLHPPSYINSLFPNH